MAYPGAEFINRRGVLVAGAAGALAAMLPNQAHAASRRAAEGAGETLRQMSLEAKVGQLFMPYVYGASATTRDSSDVAKNQQAWGVDNAAELIEKYHPGAVIYFAWANNLRDPKQIASLSNGIQRESLRGDSPVPMLIGTDQEHGEVVRIGPPATMFPGNMALGAGRRTEDTRRAARIAGSELAAMGVTQNFAPDADVNINPANPVIGIRSFGSDPEMAAAMTGAAVRGYQDGGGISVAAKHFPGHGDTTTDSHHDLPTIEHTRDQWRRIDKPPFAAAIDAGTHMIMTGHLVFPALDDSGDPATLSEPIMTGLLREKLGYDGVVVSDALSMAAVREKYGDEHVPVKAIRAGVDLLDKPPEGKLDLQVCAVRDAVLDGTISRKRLDEAVERILRLKAELGLFDDPYVAPDKVGERVGTKENHAAAQRITDRTITLVKNDDDILPLSTGASVLLTGCDDENTTNLARRLTERGLSTDSECTGTEPSEKEIDDAVEAAEQHDVTLVVTTDAGDHPEQQRLVRGLVDTGKPVVAAAVGQPYDVAHFPDVPGYLATYGDTDVSLEALAKVLTGAIEPAGKLPVMIPEAADPDTELYAYGFGLGYERGTHP